MTMPEDYPGGVGEMLQRNGAEAYNDLVPLDRRQMSAIKVNTKGGSDSDFEESLARKYGWSAPMAGLSQLARKRYGYLRDCNVTDPVAQSAIRGSNELNDFFSDAPCVNRQGRFDEEEKRAQEWSKLAAVSKADKDDDAPDIDVLLKRWSEADAFMLRARIVEEQRGIEAATPLYPRYLEMEKQRDEVLMEAAELPPAENMLFSCRLRQYGIWRERAYDLAMGYPVHDFTEVRKALHEGADIHDVADQMPWTFLLGYRFGMASMMDGKEHRTMMMSFMSQQMPQQAPPWGMPYGPWPGMQPDDLDDEEREDGEPPDKRKAIFNLAFMRRNGGRQQQPKRNNRRRRRRGNRR